MKKYQYRLVPQSIWQALPEADAVFIYSLIPISKSEIAMLGNAAQIPTYTDYLHDYPINQTVDVTDRDARVTLMTSLVDDTISQREPKRCFSPRHGVSITTGDQRTDMLLCYEFYYCAMATFCLLLVLPLVIPFILFFKNYLAFQSQQNLIHDLDEEPKNHPQLNSGHGRIKINGPPCCSIVGITMRWTEAG